MSRILINGKKHMFSFFSLYCWFREFHSGLKKTIIGANYMFSVFTCSRFTPFCVENTKMATLPSLIYAHKVGGLNEKRCKKLKTFRANYLYHNYTQQRPLKCPLLLSPTRSPPSSLRKRLVPLLCQQSSASSFNSAISLLRR